MNRLFPPFHLPAVLASPEGYFGKTRQQFFDPAVAAMHQAGQSLMPYMLIDENDV
jgi:hypothetical protein